MSLSYAMTPKRRFLSAILGGRVDRIPIGSPTSVATVEQIEITGAYFPEVHCDGEKMARLAAGAYEILGYDAIMPYFSVQAEAAALGCVVDWGDVENMPVERSHPWAAPDQVCIPDDFLSRPSIKAVLDAIRLLRAQYGQRVAIVGKVMGPWTLSYHVDGLQDFLLETLTAPAKGTKARPGRSEPRGCRPTRRSTPSTIPTTTSSRRRVEVLGYISVIVLCTFSFWLMARS